MMMLILHQKNKTRKMVDKMATPTCQEKGLVLLLCARESEKGKNEGEGRTLFTMW